MVQGSEQIHPGDMQEPDATYRTNNACWGKIIWWCCLIRNRLLALGLHKPGCVHKDVPPCELPCEENFGLESVFPRYTNEISKSKSISNFIHQCELNELIAIILLFQATSRDAKSRVVSMEETLEVKKIHTDLAE